MAKEEIKLTFKGGGWVLALMGVMLTMMLVWALYPAIMRTTEISAGDGKDIESFAFDLTNLSINQNVLVPGMHHRNMSPALSDPKLLTVEALASRNNVHRNKFLVSKDLVVGVTLNGESRVYPLHMLHVHEIVNDTLGGVPIVVSWHWPSGHIAVHERKPESQFANSGLIGNGTLLMYELSDVEGGEQLYSPLLSQTVTGEVQELELIPHEVTSWASWFPRHQETTSIAPIEGMKKRYRKGNPRIYFSTEKLYFPVEPMPADAFNPKTTVIAIETLDSFAVYAINQLVAEANDEGLFQTSIDGNPISIEVNDNPLFAVARDGSGKAIPSHRALWMNWHALHPEAVLQKP